jgi:hypothetical protein
MLAAAITKLRELQAASGRLLILRRRVIALLAYRALQRHDFTHLFILSDFPDCRKSGHFVRQPDLILPAGRRQPYE